MANEDKGLAVVTGASSGLGHAFARDLAARGYDLLIVARRKERLEELAERLRAEQGRTVHVLATDLVAQGGPKTLLDYLEEHRLIPALLVNNAGFGQYGAVVEQDLMTLVDMVRLNVETATILSHEIGKMMARHQAGGIINVSSITGFQPCPYLAVYGATKAYLTSFSEAMAVEMRPYNVRVMALCPGPTESEFHEKADSPTQFRKRRLVPAEDCVRRALDAYEAGRVVRTDGLFANLRAFSLRFFPKPWIRNVAGKMLKPK
ncbi:MAG: SDR family oxidoreductase [Sumerlaeia bacterium]